MVIRVRPVLISLILGLLTLFLSTFHPAARSQLGHLASKLPTTYHFSPTVFSSKTSGIVTVSTDKALARHPIIELIEEGRKRYHEIQRIKEGVQSLNDAVKDYQRAFNMDPPEGFDTWYTLSVELNATTAPSLIPLAHTSVLPFLSLPPTLLRQRVKDVLPLRAMCGMKIQPENTTHQVGLYMLDDVSERRVTPFDWEKMIKEDVARLPRSQDPEQPLVLAIWADDSAFRMVDGWIVEESISLAQRGQVWDEDTLAGREAQAEERFSWRATCPPGAQAHDLQDDSSEMITKRFVSDIQGASDYCEHPELLAQNGELLMREDLPVRPMQPVMVIGRPLHGVEMIGPPTQRTQEEPIPWANKTDDRLLWRGQISGIYHVNRHPWRKGHRDRLAFMVNNEGGRRVDLLLDQDDGQVGVEQFDQEDLVERYLDIGIVNENIDWHCGLNGAQQFACRIDEQVVFPECPGYRRACEDMLKEHKWKERVSLEDSQLYKFVLDVDGYGWSSRWRKELSSGSAIIKITIYNEWWSAQAVPWYHFIPSLYDYSDLFDIMAFFTGSPDGTVPGRDDLAEEIGRNGQAFAMEKLRWEDMRSYMFLLLLEYRRAWSDDRGAATFKG